MATVADVLAQGLVAAGIDTVFGLPGGENVEVLDALRRHGLDFVLAKNESSAVFMADATARLSGRPGVALATLGPGAGNAFCGMAHAYLDRAPVLLITAQSSVHYRGRHTHQALDLQAIFTPVSKWCRELTSVRARQMVAEALRVTLAGRPGPVHLRLSDETAAQEVVESEDETAPGATRPAASDTALIAEARASLAQARRPLIVVGLGAEPEKPYEAIRQLAEAAQAPVVVTPKAKGALSDAHPLAAGTFGLTRDDPPYRLVDESDCIVAVAFDVVELVRPWQQPQPLIWVAPWANTDPALPSVRYELVGETAPVLEALAQADFHAVSEWGEARVAAFRREEKRRVRSAAAPERLQPRLQPQAFLAALRAVVPAGVVVTTDVGAHKIAAGLSWPVYVPNTYLVSNGLSAMGYGLPAAIAAARASGQPSLCLTGDGGLHMVLGELSVARELSLPVIAVVFNDNALDLIRSAQRRRGKAVYGTEFANPNYAAVARGFGLDFYRVEDEAGVREALGEALARGRPALVEVLIDPAGYPTAP